MWKWLENLLARLVPGAKVRFLPVDSPVSDEAETLARSVLQRAQSLVADREPGQLIVIDVTAVREDVENVDPGQFSLCCAKLASEYGLRMLGQIEIRVTFVKV